MINMSNWFNQTAKEVEENLKTNMQTGLQDEEIKTRQEKYGFNELKQQKKKSLFIKFLE